MLKDIGPKILKILRNESRNALELLMISISNDWCQASLKKSGRPINEVLLETKSNIFWRQNVELIMCIILWKSRRKYTSYYVPKFCIKPLDQTLNPVVFTEDKIIAKVYTKQDKSCVFVFPLNNFIPIEYHDEKRKNKKHAKAKGCCMRSCIQYQQNRYQSHCIMQILE